MTSLWPLLFVLIIYNSAIDSFFHLCFRDVKGNEKNDGFEFFRWSCIDIFVYFSHHLVTIPPLGWINAAHKNGVMVLGNKIDFLLIYL